MEHLKSVPFSNFLSLFQELCRDNLKRVEYSKSLLEFYLKGENGKLNFQEKRTGILSKVGPKHENSLET